MRKQRRTSTDSSQKENCKVCINERESGKENYLAYIEGIGVDKNNLAPLLGIKKVASDCNVSIDIGIIDIGKTDYEGIDGCRVDDLGSGGKEGRRIN